MSSKNKNIINLIFLALTLLVNALGAFGKINGLSQKQVSDMYPTPITPAPFTFSIWSIIYLLLLISILYLIKEHKHPTVEAFTDQFTPLFLLSSVLNILWIIGFSYRKLIFSSMIIVFFLFTLLAIMKLIRQHPKLRPVVMHSFDLYAGWLTIASLVNIASTLIKYQWKGWGIAFDVWIIFALGFILILAFFIEKASKSRVFTLPIAWAFLGIYHNEQTFTSGIEWMLILGIIYLIFLSFKNWLQAKENI